jgi:RHS repeat-associated protein
MVRLPVGEGRSRNSSGPPLLPHSSRPLLPDRRVGKASSGSTSHYFITDSLGSVVGMFAPTGGFEGGYSYSPYGEARFTSTNTAATQNTQRYIAGQLDQASTYKLGDRYYDTSLGRFTQMDPSGKEANPYAYAGCNPINAKDPTGLEASGECWAQARDILI